MSIRSAFDRSRQFLHLLIDRFVAVRCEQVAPGRNTFGALLVLRELGQAQRDAVVAAVTISR